MFRFYHRSLWDLVQPISYLKFSLLYSRNKSPFLYPLIYFVSLAQIRVEARRDKIKAGSGFLSTSHCCSGQNSPSYRGVLTPG